MESSSKHDDSPNFVQKAAKKVNDAKNKALDLISRSGGPSGDIAGEKTDDIEGGTTSNPDGLAAASNRRQD